MTSEADARYMARALRLARRGLYTASPNPCVGCVVVHDGRVVGEGWHERTGSAHAEAVALGRAGPKARGATVYLTLEPCTHHGRTPPCVGALAAAGIARAVVAVRDPDPRVAGGGIAALKAAGVAVEVGVCESEARALNRGFFSRMRRKRPWVRIKWGMSLDGRVASSSGNARWITGDDARRDVQFERARCGALLTGAGTVLADDPRLDLRLGGRELGIGGEPSQPLRVVIDGALRTSPDARIYRAPGSALVAARDDAAGSFERAGVELWRFPRENDHVPLARLLERLAGRGINEVQVEAGPGLSGALIEQGLYDEILLYFAPCLLGGGGFPPAALGGITTLEQRETLEWRDVRRVGRDMKILVRRADAEEKPPARRM